MANADGFIVVRRKARGKVGGGEGSRTGAALGESHIRTSDSEWMCMC